MYSTKEKHRTFWQTIPSGIIYQNFNHHGKETLVIFLELY